MRIAVSLLFALTMAVFGASHAADSYAFGNRLLVIGDSAGKLTELAGTPIRKEPVENTFGAQQGERICRERTGENMGYVDDADALEGSAHAVRSPVFTLFPDYPARLRMGQGQRPD